MNTDGRIFAPRSGIGQRCPFSSLLFYIVQKAVREGKEIKGIQMVEVK